MERLIDNLEFWTQLDKLIESTEIVIDRPKGMAHPRYPDFVYPIDYGYLKGTQASDNAEIDIWVGSLQNKKVDAVMCTVDLVKKDSEMKILLGCTEEEKKVIYKVYDSEYMKGILIRR